MNAVLRPAASADADDVANVLLASRARFLPDAPSPHSDDEVRRWVRHVLLLSEDVTVAEENGAVIGVMAVRRTPDATWITQLYLHPSHVARGIGSRLLGRALGTVPPPIRLYTFQQNSGARRFYERHGFVPISFSDGAGNEERCPDVLYELLTSARRDGEPAPDSH